MEDVTPNISLPQSDLTQTIIGAFYDVYNQLGRGFLESVYERSLSIALSEADLKAQLQAPVDVYYRKRLVGHFRADWGKRVGHRRDQDCEATAFQASSATH